MPSTIDIEGSDRYLLASDPMSAEEAVVLDFSKAVKLLGSVRDSMLLEDVYIADLPTIIVRGNTRRVEGFYNFDLIGTSFESTAVWDETVLDDIVSTYLDQIFQTDFEFEDPAKYILSIKSAHLDITRDKRVLKLRIDFAKVL